MLKYLKPQCRQCAQQVQCRIYGTLMWTLYIIPILFQMVHEHKLRLKADLGVDCGAQQSEFDSSQSKIIDISPHPRHQGRH